MLPGVVAAAQAMQENERRHASSIHLPSMRSAIIGAGSNRRTDINV
jgi:hypothetical protein